MPLLQCPALELEKLALEHIAPRLLASGYCYLDHILGEELGERVLQQVRRLHQEGALKDGQLAGPLQGVSKRHLRGDKIAWIAGTEDGCEAIGLVLSVIDRLVVLCGGQLGQYYVKERSKAMVACYPGNGAGYVRHVDNPTGDGRCITCIYYLNKDWDAKVHGGVLRIFPDGGSRVADVEPLFDRLLFFWSDRRNPHEVQPSYATRYALTVWYFDAKERAAAKQRFKRLSARRRSGDSAKPEGVAAAREEQRSQEEQNGRRSPSYEVEHHCTQHYCRLYAGCDLDCSLHPFYGEDMDSTCEQFLFSILTAL